MSRLPIAVSERMGGRARLPALQIFVILAKWRIKVRRKPLYQARLRS